MIYEQANRAGTEECIRLISLIALLGVASVAFTLKDKVTGEDTTYKNAEAEAIKPITDTNAFATDDTDPGSNPGSD